MMNKKGFSTGFTWVYALVSLFGIGVLYVVFNQVFLQYLVPTIKNAVNTTNVPSATVTTVYANIDKYMQFWNLVPFILFGAIVVYLIIAAIRREREEDML